MVIEKKGKQGHIYKKYKEEKGFISTSVISFVK